jgi:FtsP/CotA-like multicopper oxidase with cupredoxin domain
MSDGLDRRNFLGLGAGAAGLFCSLTSKDIPNLSTADVKRIDAAAASLPAPAAARAAAVKQGADVVDTYSFDTPEPQPGGQVREYWIQAVPVMWNPIPTGFDTWMNMKQTTKPFLALCYQEMSANFTTAIGPPTMPGPLLEAEVGDVLKVNFLNGLANSSNKSIAGQAVTMHPHGVRYTPDYDGAYYGAFTRVGGFIGPRRKFTYTWECTAEGVGVWPYHDHGPNHVLNSARGLFGSIIIREKGAQRPDQEYFLHLHSLTPQITGLPFMLHAINGRAFAGNTPTMRAKVGDDVAIHVFDQNSDFHTFHMHGHRWKDPDGTNVDSPGLGPQETRTIRFTEDNPGRWLYHCHVSAHQDAGMAGWYLVER